jgi:hypothetical protein
MAQQWYQFTGEAIDATDPRLANYIDDLASGKVSLSSWTENVVKRQALLNPESPWSRDIRTEQQAQGQFGVDVENTAQRIKDLAKRWGVTWSEESYQEWADKIVNRKSSEAEVLQALKGQAQVLYAWKDPEMETAQAAQPWIETYRRVMESEVDLTNPKVQQALSAGMSVWDFEKSLKGGSDWLGTKNARQEMVGVISEAGRRMGFA